jgi:hypothetical protein
MSTDVGRLSWVDGDAKMVIAAQATRSFAQSAVAVLTAIYLSPQGFSMVQVGTFLTVGALGAALGSGVPTLLQRSLGFGEFASFRPCFVAYAVLALLTALLYSGLSGRVELPSGEARWTNPFTLPSRGRIFALAGLFTVDSFGTGLIVQTLASYWFFTRLGL